MLWEIEILPAEGEVDREGARIAAASQALGLKTIRDVRAARSYLLQGSLDAADVEHTAARFLVDPIVEVSRARQLSGTPASKSETGNGKRLLNVLYKPGVTDNVASSAKAALADLGLKI